MLLTDLVAPNAIIPALKVNSKKQILPPAPCQGRSASLSAAPVVWPHRQFGLGVGCRFRRDGEKLAAEVLNRGVLELVVLALLVELDAGADADIVGDVGGADGVGERLRVGRARPLVGIRRN